MKLKKSVKFNSLNEVRFFNKGDLISNFIFDGKKKSIKRRSGEKQIVILKKSSKPEKKFMVLIGNKTIHFGAKGYDDYTIHKDNERMHRYENRHRSNENWKKSGIESAGFWSKWILWNKPSLIQSIKNTQEKFNIKIQYKIQSKRKSKRKSFK